MSSVKTLGQRWQSVVLGAAVLMILQTLGLAGSWAQESAEPRLDEEIAKQDRIYQKQGDEVPRGYITNRGLGHYAELLPSGFCAALGKLDSSDRWLDIGAGSGQAILDYYTPAEGASCAWPGAKAQAVAMSIENLLTDKWRELAKSLSGDRLRYLSGKRLRDYSPKELGKFQIITDVFGGFTFTEDLYQFVDKVLSFLEVGGSFYTLVPGVRLNDGKEKLGGFYLTQLENAAGRPETVCSWLKKTSCARVTCESKSDWIRPTELIKIDKVCSAVAVPRMKVVEFVSGYPPDRRFQLEP